MSNDLIINLFTLITKLGDYQMLVLLMGLGLGLALYYRDFLAIKFMAIAVVGATVSTLLLKHYIEAPRPIGGLIETYTYSFPSGHTTVAVSFYVSLFILLRYQINLIAKIVLLLIATLLPISRIMLNVHYPIDILGGAFVGVVWILISLQISKRPIKIFGKNI